MFPWILLAVALNGSAANDAAACARIAGDRERLACYDAAYRNAPAPQAASDASPVPPPAAPAKPVTAVNPEAEFGLSVEEKEKRRGADTTDQIRSLVTAVEPNRTGKPSFSLENGQRWIQTEVTPMPAIKSGDLVEIRRASMGSFLASVPGSGRPAVRVRRLE